MVHDGSKHRCPGNQYSGRALPQNREARRPFLVQSPSPGYQFRYSCAAYLSPPISWSQPNRTYRHQPHANCRKLPEIAQSPSHVRRVSLWRLGNPPFDEISISYYIDRTRCAMATEPSPQPSYAPPSKPAMPASVAFEKHYCVSEVAELWGLSERTIRRIFTDEPGVIKWENAETRFKRGYTTLRIPESVVQRVHRKLRKAG